MSDQTWRAASMHHAAKVKAERERDEAKAEADKLAEALDAWLEYGGPVDIEAIARSALAAYRGGDHGQESNLADA